jgi:hypothetical protein
MVLKILQKKWHKIAAILVASFVVLVLIAAIFVNQYWSPILSDKVKDVVTKSSDSLYTVSFSSAELHIIRGTIDIYNIVLKPDTAVYNRRKKQNLAPNNLVELRVKRIVLSHIHPYTLYFRHRLDIGQVELDQPQIRVSYQLNHKKDTVTKDNKTVWQKISKSLHSIHVGTILLGDIKMKYDDYSGNKLEISELKEMDVTARDLLIDSATQADKSRILFCRDIVTELNDYVGKSPNGLYTYKVKHLRLSTQLSRLNAEGLSVKPVPADAFFTKSRTDKFTLNVDSLQLNNFDYLNYHKYRVVDAASLSLHGGSLEVFGNPNHTKQLTDRVITFPNAAIFLINADVKLDTIRLKRVAIYYSEYNAKDNKVGTISFNNTSGIVTNITTRPAAIAQNNFCNLDLTSYLMNRGKLNVHFTFNLADANKSFSYKGSLGRMNLKDINPAIRPLTMVKLNSGTIQELDFDIQANRTGSHGTVRALYTDLSVSLLKKDSMFNSLQTKPIVSLFANIFIIKHNNPDKPGDAPRVAVVTYTRESDVPFFKFVWQGLLNGIKPEVGLDKKTQDQTAELIKQQAADKADRQTRRAARLARRAIRRQKRAEKQQQAAATQ